MTAKGFTKGEIGRAEAELTKLLAAVPLPVPLRHSGDEVPAAVQPYASHPAALVHTSERVDAPRGTPPGQAGPLLSARGVSGGSTDALPYSKEANVTWTMFQRIWMMEDVSHGPG